MDKEWVKSYLKKRRELYLRSKDRLSSFPSNDLRDQILDFFYYLDESIYGELDLMDLEVFLDVFKDDDYIKTKGEELKVKYVENISRNK